MDICLLVVKLKMNKHCLKKQKTVLVIAAETVELFNNRTTSPF